MTSGIYDNEAVSRYSRKDESTLSTVYQVVAGIAPRAETLKNTVHDCIRHLRPKEHGSSTMANWNKFAKRPEMIEPL
jgi:hypothetical protein